MNDTAEALTPESPSASQLQVVQLGRVDYASTWHAMQDYTNQRDSTSADQLWLVEHPRVFTLGQAGRSEHVIAPGDIPVIHVDRGGQVTYHGPGQQVLYILVDLKRLGMGVRQLVTHMEQSVVELLADYDITAQSRSDAPGVYVAGRKIASLGLKVRHGRTFHGLALNVDMDLEPFLRINPCGYAGLEMTQCKDLGGPKTLTEAGSGLVTKLAHRLGYRQWQSLAGHTDYD